MPERSLPSIPELLETVDQLSTAELDGLPYGVIQLDTAGRILKYNATESELASLPQAEAIGKQFFTEVAPCTRVQEFYGRFTNGVIQESLDVSFPFHFAFKQHPRDVLVHLWFSRRTRSVWVLIREMGGARVPERVA
ncbi:MAG: PAS domain-containing protein [Gemmatimonadaceae bacterium]|nr:PAS domain-containing protein [Gemmatimonadaceae bacterium]